MNSFYSLLFSCLSNLDSQNFAVPPYGHARSRSYHHTVLPSYHRTVVLSYHRTTYTATCLCVHKIKSQNWTLFIPKRADLRLHVAHPKKRPHARTSHTRFESLFARTSQTCGRARTCACAKSISQLTDWKKVV